MRKQLYGKDCDFSIYSKFGSAMTIDSKCNTVDNMNTGNGPFPNCPAPAVEKWISYDYERLKLVDWQSKQVNYSEDDIKRLRQAKCDK